MTAMRVKGAPRRPLILPTDFQLFTGPEVPDPITFMIGAKWLNRPLYPRQATYVKVVFLRTDLLTEYDYTVIAEWEASFAATGNNGITVGILERMGYLRKLGYRWFREILLVLGRRAGKGYLSALCMAYVLWNYLAKGDPQEHYHIDRDKKLDILIYAGKKAQARDNLYRDLVNIIMGGPCFAPYVNRPLGESLSVFAPADRLKIAKLARRGISTANLDMATFKIQPKEATTMSGRGGASCVLAFDEMAHAVATGATRSAEEVYTASTPSLDQFGLDAFIVEPSSPWQMIGQFYKNWQQTQELSPDGSPVYPERMFLQLASWEIYTDWEMAHLIDLFPPDFTGDLGEYLDVEELPRLGQLYKAIQDYDEAMQRLEKSNPDMFAVERLSHWQSTQDAYLDPRKIALMFSGPLDPEGNPSDEPLTMHTRGLLSHFYKGHADPSLVNDNFGFAVAHTEIGPDGWEVVVFDWIQHWNPAEFPEHTIDYVQVEAELWDAVKGFPIDNLTFDQHNSASMIAHMNEKIRKAQLPKRVSIGLETATAPHNLKVAESFKMALNQGWIRAPYYEQADLELRFLQFKNGKVTHQDTGPVVHDDVARCMMEVTDYLISSQIVRYLTGGTPAPITGTSIGGNRPWMATPSSDDNAILGQFRSLQAARGMPSTSPARGRAGMTPTGVQGGRGRPPGYRR